MVGSTGLEPVVPPLLLSYGRDSLKENPDGFPSTLASIILPLAASFPSAKMF